LWSWSGDCCGPGRETVVVLVQSPEKLFRRFLRNARCEIMADTVDEDNVEEHQKVDEFKVIIFFNIH
jgi:hypothetical protein